MEDSNIGRILDGKYELIRVLGKGGMGAVYEAHHHLIKRRLAVKLLHEEYAKQEWTVQRFKQEAQAATAIGHEHIVDITDMGVTEDGELFIVMEYLDGIDLASLLREERCLSVKRACHIVIQMLSALEAAHAKGIIHRDLKPANIFLIEHAGAEDYVKLVDFGISKVKQMEQSAKKALTRTGELLGTPSYMSPEQAIGEVNITPRSDIFSVGVILYSLLAGELPFQGNVMTAVLMKIMNEEAKDVRELRPETPAVLADAVKTAMAKKPEDRFRDAADFRRALIPFSPDTPVLTGLKSTQYAVRPSALPRVSGPGFQTGPHRDTTPVALTETVSKRGSKTLLTVIGLGLAVVVAVGAVFFMGLGPFEKKDKPPQVIPVISPPNKAASGASEKAEEVAEPKEPEIVLSVDVTPSSATVLIDGFPIGTGSQEKRLKRDGSSHEVSVQAPGYSEFVKSVTFDKSVNLTVVLGRAGTAKTTDKGKPEDHGKERSASKLHGETASAKTDKKTDSKSPSETKTTSPKKDDDKQDDSGKVKDSRAPYRGSPAPFRPIDEDAPW